MVSSGELTPGSGRGELFRAEDEEPTALEAILARTPRLRDVPLLIEHSGVDWSPGTFVLLSLGIGAAFGLFALVALGGLLSAVALATWALGCRTDT
jgi:Flp pilus assembly protein TadB